MPIVLCQVFPSSRDQEAPGRQDQEAQRALRRRREEAIRRSPSSRPGRSSPTPEGDAKPEEFPDLLHPNEAGYAKWAAALRPILATLGFFETGADNFTPEPGFVSLFNGRDLTGWGYRPTSEKDKASAARWQATDPAAAAWPIVTEAVSFDGQTARRTAASSPKNGRLVVTTPPEGPEDPAALDDARVPARLRAQARVPRHAQRRQRRLHPRARSCSAATTASPGRTRS